MTEKVQSILVIGAGIVGCSCALWLQQKGFTVTIADSDEPGAGTSSGNACTIADYATIPVNSSSIFNRIPQLLFSKNSPFSLNPFFALGNVPWLIKFLSHCREDQVSEISRKLAILLNATYDGLTPLIEMANAQDLLQQKGCMYVYKTEADFQAAKSSNQVRRDLGASFTELNQADINDLEPHLKPFERGLLFQDASQVINPRLLVERYAKTFQQQSGILLKSKVTELTADSSKVTATFDDGGSLEYDQIVVAAGAFSRSIKGSGAESLPLSTERGYHVQYSNCQHLLTRPVCWGDAGFYATPTNQGMRFAGTVELAGYSPIPNRKHLDYLTRRSKEMLDVPEKPEQEWLGFRPTFPDALPVIDYSPVSNRILLAFGHQHIGLTLAGITGKIISELANNQQPSQNIIPFQANRF